MQNLKWDRLINKVKTKQINPTSNSITIKITTEMDDHKTRYDTTITTKDDEKIIQSSITDQIDYMDTNKLIATNLWFEERKYGG